MVTDRVACGARPWVQANDSAKKAAKREAAAKRIYWTLAAVVNVSVCVGGCCVGGGAGKATLGPWGWQGLLG